MRYLCSLLAGLALSLFAVTLAAQEAMPPFEDLDADKDGQISTSEASVHQGLSDTFEIVDVDESGAISLEEYEVFVKG